MRKTLAGLAASALIATMALVAPSAEAGPTAPTFTSINTTPDKVVFKSADAIPVQMVVDMDEPNNQWVLQRADFFSCTSPTGALCTFPTTPNNLLDFKSDSKPLPTRRLLNFAGNIPNVYANVLNRIMYYQVKLTYKNPQGALVTVSSNLLQTFPRTLYMQGDTKVTISGPETSTTGKAVTVTGNVTCFTRTDYDIPPANVYGDNGFAEAQFQLEGETTWRTLGDADISSTGALKYTALAVGATGNWRFHYTSTPCVEAFSPPFKVTVSDQPATPKPPVTLPQSNAPSFQLVQKTYNSLSFSWSAPSKPDSAIKSYHWHWVSSNGQPQKEFDVVYAADKAPKPVVFTGLFPKTNYHVTVSAVTEKGGEGAIAAKDVKTLKAPKK